MASGLRYVLLLIIVLFLFVKSAIIPTQFSRCETNDQPAGKLYKAMVTVSLRETVSYVFPVTEIQHLQLCSLLNNLGYFNLESNLYL